MWPDDGQLDVNRGAVQPESGKGLVADDDLHAITVDGQLNREVLTATNRTTDFSDRICRR